MFLNWVHEKYTYTSIEERNLIPHQQREYRCMCFHKEYDRWSKLLNLSAVKSQVFAKTSAPFSCDSHICLPLFYMTNHHSLCFVFNEKWRLRKWHFCLGILLKWKIVKSLTLYAVGWKICFPIHDTTQYICAYRENIGINMRNILFNILKQINCFFLCVFIILVIQDSSSKRKWAKLHHRCAVFATS